MRQTLRTKDLWQTGRDLWETSSGILTETIENEEQREGDHIDLPTPALACGVLCKG